MKCEPLFRVTDLLFSLDSRGSRPVAEGPGTSEMGQRGSHPDQPGKHLEKIVRPFSSKLLRT